MKKDEINALLRNYVKKELTPNKTEREFVTNIYQSFNLLLGINNCIRIGSFPRFTAIRPLHDLDILYILGEWDEQNHSPQKQLKELLNLIKSDYENITNYTIETLLQTHSVTVIFKDSNYEEIFLVDIVPAYIFSKNEFQQDTYKVPEILKQKRRNRKDFYQNLLELHNEMNWIATDPRGYIEVSNNINKSNNDFRKAVKFLKSWKNSCKEKYNNFKFKSFHIEQVIVAQFKENKYLDIYDSIFKFFIEIPEIIQSPKINDRANSQFFIDEYLNNLTEEQKQKIIEARDCFLKKLEEYSENDSIETLVKGCFYKRASNTEQFLFDFKIPVLTDEQYNFNIDGYVKKKDGFRNGWISKLLWKIELGRYIKFEVVGNKPSVDYFKWKVKNDNNSPQPRGEITDHRTYNESEQTKYKGNHYVECFAISNNICVAKARQNVNL